ncbi:MAG TPA: helix-turn-helix domain-containing protein [Saprospiraceae bacterium]|nr:helix-turn-helix domain-containing protein [Saprospiraceae bacterium]
MKVRQFRQERGWNFEEMSRRSGISISYLNEIEKGKKYPQPENQRRLATALGVTPEFLASPELTKQFAPLGDLLKSNFLNELPLDLFGIELQQVVEIIARAPDRVNAFISALLEIARNYSLRDENFFFAALRAYQELRNNYFEEIEEAADTFVQHNNIPGNGGVPSSLLARLLCEQFDYRIDEHGLEKYPQLQSLRSVFNPHHRLLMLNSRLNERQRAFQLAKELGFNVLDLKERPFASNLLRVNSFEETLNNYKAAYFAVAILINRHAFVRDVGDFFSRQKWDGPALLGMMSKYQASPEVLFQRFNVLTKDFRLEKVFFLRFIHDLDRDRFDIDKELHLNRRHQPHATGLNEYYCRRWLSLTLLRDLQSQQGQGGNQHRLLAGVQRAAFLDTNEEYLCIAVAKPGYPTVDRNVSVTLGVLLDDHAKQTIRFWDDPAIPRFSVNVTCERCSLTDCAERAAPPTVVQKREERRQMQELLNKLTDK